MACALVYLLVRRITESPYGRSLRAMRDNDIVADSLGKNLLSLRTAMSRDQAAPSAALSGGILVSYITTWSPAAWGCAETVVLFAAVIIGGGQAATAARSSGRSPVPGRLRGSHALHPHLQ